MKRPTTLAALTQVDYLQRKIDKMTLKIENKGKLPSEEKKQLYFELGKAYSDLELMKRVQPYD